jgi:ABC-type antimicrobial peptide transport system permease subunit
MINDGSSPELVSAKINRIMENNLPSYKNKMYLQPLNRIHFNSSQLKYDYALTGEIKYVYICTALGLFILVIACINFTNLSTARASTRGVEIGMRKVIGAEKWQLVKQFFAEAILMSFIASLFAFIFVIFLMPVFNTISGKNISLDVVLDPSILFGITGIIIFTGVISGSYPALFLASQRPIPILRGMTIFGSKKSIFRKILVVSQFAISIFLIICTAVIFSQMNFIKNRDLGYNKENLVIFGLEYFNKSYDVLRNELLQSPYIVNVGRGHQPIWDRIGQVSPEWEGKDPSSEVIMQTYAVDYDYFETYEMKIIQGRSFDKERTIDAQNYVINESASKMMGLKSPVGKNLTVNGIGGQIIGVVKDFNHSSLHSPIRPIIFKIGRSLAVAVKLNPNNTQEAFKFLKEWWKYSVPEGVPFDGTSDGYFLESKLDSFYSEELRLSKLVGYFTILGVFIACLGLFGLSSFSADRRTKEIGIRKTLGASVSSIIKLLSKEFLVLVSISNIISWPFAYYVMNKWLQSFAYRTNISSVIFFFAATAAVIIAFTSIIYQSIKAARANPVDSLRYE